jgi:GH25 family lysozyme M1 (1,4-beta-N-acetylmuramidase)
MMRALGIDVSAIQNRSSGGDAKRGVVGIDWSRVAASGIDFAIVKGSVGIPDGDEDAFAALNAEHARAAGLLVGMYHLWVVGANARKQADNIEDYERRCGGVDLPVAIDFEGPAPHEWEARGLAPERLAAECLALVYELEARKQRMPILYTYPHFWAKLPETQAKQELAQRTDLWIAGGANYLRPWTPGDRDQPPYVKHFANRWKIWQYGGGDATGGGLPVPGIAWLCDRNVFNGDAGQLREYCKLTRAIPEELPKRAATSTFARR